MAASERETLVARLRGAASEFTDEDMVRRGQHVARILESDVFRDAFSDAELTLVEEWRSNEDSSPTGRERAHAALKGLDVLWLALTRIMDDGLVAGKRVEDAQGEAEAES